MYGFARWMYVDRHKRQKFDNIEAGHEAALVSMGVVKSARVKDETGPTCPAMFTATHEKYRGLKFLQRYSDGTMVIYPRDVLKWQDLIAYREMSGETISTLEAELIMGIDAIFEGRDDG